LIEAAFGDHELHLGALVGLSPRAAQALIAAVLAERGQQGVGASLSYMGAPCPGTRSRDMLDQVLYLLAPATSRIELIGVRPGDDPRLLRTISHLVDARGLSARVVFDARGGVEDLAAAKALADATLRGAARDAVYGCAALRLRARVVICDGRHVLVTSADLSSTEQAASFDVGALLDDPRYAASLLEELERALALGHWVAI
jgi:hypothetical protein